MTLENIAFHPLSHFLYGENGAVVALLWGREIEEQPLPFDIEVFIIDTTPQNDSAPAGTE